MKAEALLRRPSHQWEVLAAVSGAVYIAARNGELLWITDRTSALHPRAILLPAMPLHVPEPDSAVESVGNHLRCEHFILGWQQAAQWTPARLSEARANRAGDLGQAIQAVGRVLPETADRESARDSSASTLFERQLSEAVDRLCRVSTERGVPAGLEAVSGIVGLGEGLTPQGDDFLGGYLFTLRALDAACCLSFDIDWESATTWLYSVAHRTNAISHTLLVDHAHGDACAPLVAFIQGALEGEGSARLSQLASDVAKIGASSGRSLLEGVQSACHMASAPRETAQHLLPVEGGETVGRPARREVARVR